MSDAASTPDAPAAPSGERRQVTVLFADMVGFTAISERLGEEGTFALIQPIYQLMAGAVREQGGSVKDFTGDGIRRCSARPKRWRTRRCGRAARGCGFMSGWRPPLRRSKPNMGFVPRCGSASIRVSRS